MKVLLTGSRGQLGQALVASKPANLSGKSFTFIPFSRKELDLTDSKACREAVEIYQPDWIINAAAYTSVDKAEEEMNLVQKVNVDAPAIFAKELSKYDGKILHLSTDFVFDGMQGKPYLPSDNVSPLSVYGRSKAESEKAVLNYLVEKAFILRTSWVYGPVGNNFALKILHLHDAKDEIKVVVDQVGTPTSTYSLADACWRILSLQTHLINLP